MKTTTKTLIALLALAAGMAPAAAQDTVYGKALRAGHYSSVWPDTTYLDTHRVYFRLVDQAGQYGLIHHTDSALTIYGIAAALCTPPDYNSPQSVAMEASDILDTSRSALRDEHLKLWEMYGDTIEEIADLPVAVSKPPDYYWDLMLTPVESGRILRPLPMYERYFPEPITVQDSFIIGKKTVNGSGLGNPPELQYDQYNWDVALCAYLAADSNGDFIRYPRNYIYETRSRTIDGNDTIYTYWWEKENRRNQYVGYSIIFPIITPNPDTGRTDTTQTGIGHMTPVERNTVVAPNPATGTVRVASGFGLLGIEVYDNAGRRIYSADANGMQTSIDVASWPRGAYTVHVRTAVGTAIKKLLVQ